jgi:hypothetical protein
MIGLSTWVARYDASGQIFAFEPIEIQNEILTKKIRKYRNSRTMWHFGCFSYLLDTAECNELWRKSNSGHASVEKSGLEEAPL